jgi:putative spermidine/putrescine transport system ATP-binding protein
MTRLTLDRLEKRYGPTLAVDAVSLEIEPGEMVVLLGPSGCGKTTTLRMIAGFIQASGGDIRRDGISILDLPPYQREMGLVFQSYALFPHLSVARNIAFGLEMRGQGKSRIQARVAKMLELTRLTALADRLPRQLSGGQQQRVALARALAIEPRLLLLDEPLSNLDAALRADVGRDIRLLQQDAGLTTIMVTHDQDEAMAMADRLVVMKDGRVEQTGRQEDLYERPATPFVARFIGRATMLAGVLSDRDRLDVGGAVLHLAARYDCAGPATLALRPERLRLDPPGASGPGSVAGVVQLASYLGPVREHLVRIGPDAHLLVRDQTARRGRLYARGEAVSLRWDDDAERLFDTANTAMTPAFMTASGPQRRMGHPL